MALAAQYNFPLGGGVEGFARLSYSYVGNALDQLTRDLKIPSYELLGARLGVTAEDWEITLFAENLNDEFVATNRLATDDSVAGMPQWTVMRPRTIGLNVRYAL
jgi:hypothetical protein